MGFVGVFILYIVYNTEKKPINFLLFIHLYIIFEFIINIVIFHQSQKKPIKNGEKMNTSNKWVLLEYLFFILYIIQKKNPYIFVCLFICVCGFF
jgi:hypothetical protein